MKYRFTFADDRGSIVVDGPDAAHMSVGDTVWIDGMPNGQVPQLVIEKIEPLEG